MYVCMAVMPVALCVARNPAQPSYNHPFNWINDLFPYLCHLNNNHFGGFIELQFSIFFPLYSFHFNFFTNAHKSKLLFGVLLTQLRFAALLSIICLENLITFFIIHFSVFGGLIDVLPYKCM